MACNPKGQAKYLNENGTELNIIMSLWPVDDEATQSLTPTFYKQWILSGDLNHAFRQAKLEAINKYPNPYYWGAFILVGN